MNDAEQMVHCYILKVGSMILHTLPFKEVVHNYYNLVELHNTVIVRMLTTIHIQKLNIKCFIF